MAVIKVALLNGNAVLGKLLLRLVGAADHDGPEPVLVDAGKKADAYLLSAHGKLLGCAAGLIVAFLNDGLDPLLNFGVHAAPVVKDPVYGPPGNTGQLRDVAYCNRHENTTRMIVACLCTQLSYGIFYQLSSNFA